MIFLPLDASGPISTMKSNLANQCGFTLMEVLVATAITAIAIGVVMALFAQGHSQAFRGLEAQRAAQIATRLIDTWNIRNSFPQEASGELEWAKGWSYSVETRDVETKITLPSGEVRQIKAENAREIVLRLLTPSGKRAFVLNFWIDKNKIKGL